MRNQEYEWLAKVIAAIGASLDLDQVLALAVQVAAEASRCKAGFLYLWNRKQERLVVRATTPGQEQHIRSIELNMGEGITGWTAKYLEPVLIEADAMKDPRFKYIPGLQEEQYQSFMTVPIVTSSKELVGVFTMYTIAPFQFPPSSLDFVNKVATLVAGLIEKARLYSEMERQLAVLNSLAGLSKTLSNDDRIDVILHKMSSIAVEATESDLSIIFLVNQDRTDLTLQAFFSSLPQVRIKHWKIKLTSELLMWLTKQKEHATTGTLEKLPRDFLRPVIKEFGTWASASISGTDRVTGLILCFRVKNLAYLDEELSVLSTIANQGSIALTRAKMVAYLTTRNLKSNFFEALIGSNYRNEHVILDKGRALGCDLARRNVVMAAEVFPVEDSDEQDSPNGKKRKILCEDSLTMLENRLEAIAPGTLCIYRDDTIQGIIPVEGSVNEVLRSLQKIKDEFENRYSIKLVMALGNVCYGIKDYAKGFEEAKEALRIGQTLFWDKLKVFTFSDLGIYRYLYRVWLNDGMVRDSQQELLNILLDYDNEHDTNLMETLEGYLENMGQINEASKELYIHRNTLRNRLEKISTLIDLDITDKSNWFPLYIALKIVKLREMAGANAHREMRG